ncbi:MAG: agmatine deiminase family protein [Verrucomicrobiota bacterium]
MPEKRRLPAEWEPQAALWLSWPVSSHIWPGKSEAIAEKFAAIAATVSRFQPVHINADIEAHVAIRSHLINAKAVWDNIELHDHPTNDVWCRDHGPIFVRDRDTGLLVTDWVFNAWGGKFEPWDLDDCVPRLVADSLDLKHESQRLILEGGAIEVNGQGVMITTDPVLLNPNRNSGTSKEDYARVFQEVFGIHEIIWLPIELPNDDTDGHIDNLARFVAEDRVVCVVGDQVPELVDNRAILKKRFPDLVELPLPDPVLDKDGNELPASYANFVIINGAVLVPTFGQTTKDNRCLEQLGECFPDREIIGIDSRLLLEEGGALHCISMNQPA